MTGNVRTIEEVLARGQQAIQQARIDAARVQFEALLNLAIDTKNPRIEAIALSWDAIADIELAKYDDAEQKALRALTLFSAAFDAVNTGHCLDTLGIIATERGDYELAAERFKMAIDAYPAEGVAVLSAWVHVDIAQMHLARGDTNECRRYAVLALQAGNALNDGRLRMWASNLMGHVESTAGNLVEARDYFDDALVTADTLRNVRCGIRAVEGFAVTAANRGLNRSAITLLAVVDQERETIGLPRSNTETIMLAPIERAKDQTPAVDVAEMERFGRTMDKQEAVGLLAKIRR